MLNASEMVAGSFAKLAKTEKAAVILSDVVAAPYVISGSSVFPVGNGTSES